MKIRALVVAILVCGCNQQVSTYSSSNGSLALSNDDTTLYAADSDSDALFVMNAASEELIARVDVGRQPEKVVVGKDDTIYVSNRMGRSISVIRKGDWQEAARLDTAVEPAGMAVDGDTLLVVNAAMVGDPSTGSLMGFDVKTLQVKFEIPVGHEPRAVAVVGNKALVSLYKLGDVVTVDLGSKQVIRAGTDTFSRVNRSALTTGSNTDFGGDPRPLPPGAFGGISKVHPRGVESLTVAPDGRQVYASTLLSTDTVLPATSTEGTKEPFPGSTGGDGYGGGTCGAGAVASPAILTFDGEGESLAQDVTTCEGQHFEGQPAQVLVSGNPTMPIQGPSASVVDPTGAYLFVAGRESNNIAILSTNSAAQTGEGVTAVKGGEDFGPRSSGFFGGGSVHTTVAVGAGPSGVAVSRDGRTAWVHNGFDHSISRLERKDGVVQELRRVPFTTDVLPVDVVEGRKLFFSAIDSRMSSQTTGISCASCHLEGREDGHVWNFSDGPRQTPSLAGRMLSKTAPFHWNGEFEGLTSFMAQTVNHRMGGVGVSPAMERQLGAFIDAQPAADNANRLAEPSEQQLRGAAVFVKAQCGSCHVGQTLTDNGFWNVGTLVTSGTLLDDVSRLPQGGFNTPSLLGVSRTAPYLHDGSVMSLKERVLKGKDTDLHGKTAQLTDGEVDDLVEYLKTL